MHPGGPAASVIQSVGHQDPGFGMEGSATFWILNHSIVLLWSTLAQPPDPPSSATCLPSGNWWRTSAMWLTSFLCTLMRLTRPMDGWPLPWALILLTSESTRTWRRGLELHENSLSTFPCLHSANLWLTAWTTMPT